MARSVACGRAALPLVRGPRALPATPLAPLPRQRPPSCLHRFDGAVRGIAKAETLGSVVRVDPSSWMSFLFGRERQLLIYVLQAADEGDADGVLGAMDYFWEQAAGGKCSDAWRLRCSTIDNIMAKKSPTHCLEIGTYCGYSALRIAKNLPEGGKLVSVEVDPLLAAIATKLVEHAGLTSRVKVLIGTVGQKLQRISECSDQKAVVGGSPQKPVAFVLCDHSKERFVPDLKLLEGAGLVGPGTVVMGDTNVYPGDEGNEGKQLMDYFNVSPQYKVHNVGSQEVNGVVVSEWVHLP